MLPPRILRLVALLVIPLFIFITFRIYRMAASSSSSFLSSRLSAPVAPAGKQSGAEWRDPNLDRTFLIGPKVMS